MAILAYTLLLAGVYKLVRIESELAAIKKLLEGQKAAFPADAPKDSTAFAADLRATEDASEYAARLLQAVNAESKSSLTPNYPVRSE
jgi:hypothetical protein